MVISTSFLWVKYKMSSLEKIRRLQISHSNWNRGKFSLQSARCFVNNHSLADKRWDNSDKYYSYKEHLESNVACWVCCTRNFFSRKNMKTQTTRNKFRVSCKSFIVQSVSMPFNFAQLFSFFYCCLWSILKYGRGSSERLGEIQYTTWSEYFGCLNTWLQLENEAHLREHVRETISVHLNQ